MTEADFSEMEKAHLDPLCASLGLVKGEYVLGKGFGHLRAEGAHAAVYLECERGLWQLLVGPASTHESACSVEQIANRFPRVRSLWGEQRLSLDEQRNFLLALWPELERMLGADGIEETRQWLSERARAHMARFEKK